MVTKLINMLPRSIRDAAMNLRWEFKAYRIHRQGVAAARRYHGATNLKLHLGSGRNYKQGWVNVDLGNKADIQLDLREPLPLTDGSFSMIYSEHFLEHIDWPGPIRMLLKECLRILEPGGTISVVVPDVELVLRSYAQGGTEEYYEKQRSTIPAHYKTQMERVNYNFRQEGKHRFCYDYETLKSLLEECGFVQVRRRDFMPELDQKDRLVGSLYAEAVKPSALNK